MGPNHVVPHEAIFSCFLMVWPSSSSKNLGVITSGLAAATRFTMAVLFVDIETTLPAQLMMSFLEIWKAWQRDPGTVSCLQQKISNIFSKTETKLIL